jgi:hypothetical protein
MNMLSNVFEEDTIFKKKNTTLVIIINFPFLNSYLSNLRNRQ